MKFLWNSKKKTSLSNKILLKMTLVLGMAAWIGMITGGESLLPIGIGAFVCLILPF